MSAQIPEILVYDGEYMHMCSEPLAAVLENRGLFQELGPLIGSYCWRRYRGTWELADGHLFLIKLESPFGLHSEAIPLSRLFPENPDRVRADWFSGTVRIVRGRLLRYVPHAYDSEYEEDFVLTFENGMLVDGHTKTNGTASADAPDAYVLDGFRPAGVPGFSRARRQDGRK